MERKTQNGLVMQLRRFASVRGKEKTWIAVLDDQRLLEIFMRLRSGEAAESIARTVKEVWKINSSSTIHSIAAGVRKFQQRVSHLLLSPLQERSDLSVDVPTRSSENESSIESLEQLAGILEARIRNILTNEGKTQIYFPIAKEISALSSLKKTILKQKQFELTHAEKDPTLIRRQQRSNDQFQRRFDLLMGMLPDEGQRIIQCSKTLLERLEKRALDMEVNPETGRYRIIRREDED